MKVPSFEDVLQAQRRIASYVHLTPVLTSSQLNRLTDAELYFKCENLQKVGAFKARGACNAVFGLDDADAARGVAAHSSGNHAAALCYAAAQRGIDATVVMPRNATASKQAAVRAYGGTIIECEPTQAAREATLAEFIADSGAVEVHPFADARVIAGQGTCALELIAQVDGLDCVLTPIGGGGLISGTCLALAARAPAIEIYGAEPENADDARRSFDSGELIEIATPQTVADGLRTNLKPLTWQFLRDHARGVLVASEAQILDAMYLTWERMKILIEPSSAVPLAAILRNPEIFRGRRVGVVITGGNVDLKNCPGCK